MTASNSYPDLINLSRVPSDVQKRILSFLLADSDQGNLVRLARCSRAMAEKILPRIYEDLMLDRTNVRAILAPLPGQPLVRRALVKRLVIKDNVALAHILQACDRNWACIHSGRAETCELRFTPFPSLTHLAMQCLPPRTETEICGRNGDHELLVHALRPKHVCFAAVLPCPSLSGGDPAFVLESATYHACDAVSDPLGFPAAQVHSIQLLPGDPYVPRTCLNDAILMVCRRANAALFRCPVKTINLYGAESWAGHEDGYLAAILPDARYGTTGGIKGKVWAAPTGESMPACVCCGWAK